MIFLRQKFLGCVLLTTIHKTDMENLFLQIHQVSIHCKGTYNYLPYP